MYSINKLFNDLILRQYGVEAESHSESVVKKVLQRAPATLLFACCMCADLRQGGDVPNSTLFLLTWESSPCVVIANSCTLRTEASSLGVQQGALTNLERLHLTDFVMNSGEHSEWVVTVVAVADDHTVTCNRLDVSALLLSPVPTATDDARPEVRVTGSITLERAVECANKCQFSYDEALRRTTAYEAAMVSNDDTFIAEIEAHRQQQASDELIEKTNKLLLN